jgi:anti-sigma factor RsiW
MKSIRGMGESLREMRTCHAVGRWLQHYLDGELDGATTTQVERHLETCVRCGLEVETYARIKTAIHDAADASPALVEDEVALERLRRFADELTGEPGEASREPR